MDLLEKYGEPCPEALIESALDHIKLLQDHVKASIAPFKYPRSVVFTKELPKTETGKIQRFRLKDTSRG